MWLHLQPNEKYMFNVTLTRLCILNFIMVISADTNNKSQIAISHKGPRCYSQHTAQHTSKKPSSDKTMPHDQMHWLKTLIFTSLQFI